MKRTIIVMTVAMAFIAATAQGADIGFRNADFEDDSGYTGGYGLSGTTNEWYMGGWLAQGENIVAWTPSTGGYIAQNYVEDDLSNQLTLDVDNDFSISFDLSAQFDGPGMGPIHLEIWTADTSLLAGQSADITIDDVVSGVFELVTIDFSVDGTAHVGEAYNIALRNPSGQIWVDNFSGTVVSTPEPATMLLLGLGGLLLRRRKA